MKTLVRGYRRFVEHEWFCIFVPLILLLLSYTQWKFLSVIRPAVPFLAGVSVWELACVFTALYVFRKQLHSLLTSGKLCLSLHISARAFLQVLLSPEHLLHLSVDTFLQELLFRKMVLECILGQGWAPGIALLFQAALFVPYHFIIRAHLEYADLPFPRYLRWILNGFLGWFLGGLYYGIVYFWSGSILWAWAFHLVHNYLGWVSRITVVRVIVERKAMEGYVFVETASGDQVGNVLPGQEVEERIPLHKAHALARRIAKIHRVPVVEEMCT